MTNVGNMDGTVCRWCEQRLGGWRGLVKWSRAGGCSEGWVQMTMPCQDVSNNHEIAAHKPCTHTACCYLLVQYMPRCVKFIKMVATWTSVCICTYVHIRHHRRVYLGMSPIQNGVPI